MPIKSTPGQADTPPKKRGPPFKPADEVKSARVEARVTPQDRESWKAKAEKAGVSLNAWIVNVCNKVK